ncbi:hypothetical protein SARC_07120 [Sphaeroforma arctica JP610]|uniref:Carbonic anhydrase n=1 Tax=Sphaeroforma arctica JP610 TaxID=667725 RepID=A0A0L0FV52_9EUKA|nr:hypothetical protein SARC_07120 [Sphaeroforma arctica JP610]KNC80514.1 hypothetical protein SARC_07120 [Sphaeroforma arctica JP610]|eukprot:XP_014154416.1 hypothetical protein SARC_07120 [Sphaeroforma arctica JP610]
MRFTLLTSLSLAIGAVPAFAAEFTYENQTAWSDISPTCGIGARQSPIDIVTADAVYNEVARDFVYTNPSLVFGMITNNGHTIQYTLNDASAANTYAEGVLSDSDSTFSLKQLHFHWGITVSNGSEHLMDGKSYPLEVHLVHLNTKYASIDEGAANADGLAVIGLFFEETADESMGTSALAAIAEYAKTNNSVEFMDGATTEKIPLNLDILVNQSQILTTKRFYTYEGSLTTPGCNEAVQWIIAEGVGKVSTSTMDAIRMAKHTTDPRRDTDGIAPNFRDTQALNGRVVTSSFDVDGNGSTINSVGPATWLIAVIAALTAMVA